MRRFLFLIQLLIASCCLWCACTRGNSETEKRLFSGMDSLLEANPDSAYKVLIAMQKEVDSIDNEAVSMRHRMYLASVANKLFLPMPSDSSFIDVVSWYDLHGTTNDRMRAYYLLGCIYRDLGESPLAMRYYIEATEKADTLSEDVDHVTLMSIYGQMAVMANRQNLPDDELLYWDRYIKEATKCDNVYESIRGREMKIGAAFLKEDFDEVFRITDECHRLYLENGFRPAAASVFPSAIYILVTRGNYAKAKPLMDEFEQSSCLFGPDGEIAPDRRHYYYTKGLYCLGVSETDSAEYYFRKVGNYGFLQESYKGLLSLYEQLSKTDSIKKYLSLYEREMVKTYERTNGIATSNMSSLYNYSRNERIAMDKTRESMNRRKLVVLLSSALIILSFSFLLYRHRMRKTMFRQYDAILQQLCKAKSDLAASKSSFTDFEQAKEKEITTYRKQLDELTNRLGRIGLNTYTHLPSYTRLKSLTDNPHKNGIPPEFEWDSLKKEISETLPVFYEFINGTGRLSEKEKQTCILVRMGFKSKEIMILLGENNIQSVSNLKSRVREKLFQDKKTIRLEELLKNLT